jgi:hypothetical protein
VSFHFPVDFVAFYLDLIQGYSRGGGMVCILSPPLCMIIYNRHLLKYIYYISSMRYYIIFFINIFINCFNTDWLMSVRMSSIELFTRPRDPCLGSYQGDVGIPDMGRCIEDLLPRMHISPPNWSLADSRSN